jgi:DNA-binding GntR family transcriptional regulator
MSFAQDPSAPPTLPRTSQAIAVRELRDRIVGGALAPGSKIIQEATAEELGVSVIPLREALKELSAHGLLEYRPQRGYFVVELTTPGLARLEDARNVVEAAAERAALPKIDAARLSAITEAAHTHELAAGYADSERLNAANRRFHRLILEPCDNPYLLRFVKQVWDGMEPYWGVVYRRTELSQIWAELAPEVLVDHQRIVDAITDGDTETAMHCLAQHRERSDAILKRFVAPTPTPKPSDRG